MAGDFCCVRTVDLRITQKGIEFLQKNSSIQKAQTFLEEMNQIILGVLSRRNRYSAEGT